MNKQMLIIGGSSDIANAIQQVATNSKKTTDILATVRTPESNLYFKDVEICNLTSSASIELLIDKLLHRKNNFDHVIFNAGVNPRVSFGNITHKELLDTFNVNLFSSIEILQGIRNKINCNGRVIFIGSILGSVPNSKSIAYGVSKGAIEILVKYLAKESCFLEKNITVNCIAPGFINTKFHKGKSPKDINRTLKEIPQNRFASPEEVANVIINVINTPFMTGQTIYLDGGYGLVN